MEGLGTTVIIWFLAFALAICGSIVGVVMVVRSKSWARNRLIGIIIFAAAVVVFFYLVETFPIEINSIEISPE